MNETYHTLKTPAEGEYREKGSKFLAFAHAVHSQEKAEAAIRSLRERYNDASHHCFAYGIGTEGDLQRANDDGEPTGTAGPPILNAIRSYGLTNIVVVVTRYFGGKKLGKRGLIDAYRAAAERALRNGKIVEERVLETVNIEHPHEVTGQVEALIRKQDAEISDARYGERVHLTIALPPSRKGLFFEDLKGIKGSSFRDL